MPSPPRRSTRSALPQSTTLGNRNSSASSTASSRPERSTRTNNTHSTTSHPSIHDVAVELQDDGDEPEDDEEPSNEITRCICDKDSYPGPPTIDRIEDLSEENDGNFFICCDNCGVWQHGGCVGIMNEANSPDAYLCEQCDKSKHDVHTDKKGQKYSYYIPVNRGPHSESRKNSMSRDHESRLKRDREALARPTADFGGSKRRSTNNSRHTYDEEEALRMAIEESKHDAPGTRRSIKRLRDESEEGKQDVKRLRTGPESLDNASSLHGASLDADSEDESHVTKSAIKRARAVAAETQRQKEQRERERAREQQREEAAGRRQARAGRRRGDEADGDENTPSGGLPPTIKQPSSSTSAPGSPPPPTETLVQPSTSHKKGAGKKPKRTGRNQYTRDRERATSPAASAAKNELGSSSEEGAALNARRASPSMHEGAHATGHNVSLSNGNSHKAKKSHKKGAGTATNGNNEHTHSGLAASATSTINNGSGAAQGSTSSASTGTGASSAQRKPTIAELCSWIRTQPLAWIDANREEITSRAAARNELGGTGVAVGRTNLADTVAEEESDPAQTLRDMHALEAQCREFLDEFEAQRTGKTGSGAGVEAARALLRPDSAATGGAGTTPSLGNGSGGGAGLRNGNGGAGLRNGNGNGSGAGLRGASGSARDAHALREFGRRFGEDGLVGLGVGGV